MSGFVWVVGKLLFKNVNFGSKNPILGKFRGKIKILSMRP